MNTTFNSIASAMKKYGDTIGVLFLIGLTLSSFAFAFSYAVSAWRELGNVSGSRQLSASGEGKVAIKPDIATVNAGALTEAKKIGDAQAENTRKSNAVLEFLKQNSIEEKDIKTAGYSIYPQYQYFDQPPCFASPCPPRRPPEIVSYQVRHTLEIKIRDLGKVDMILAGVVAHGANEVGSITFGVDDEKKVMAEARKKAIEDAEEKARVLARDLGVRLARKTGFSESGGGIPIFSRFEALGKGGGFGGDAVPAPQVAPGEQEIRSQVTITYEFR